MYPSAVCFGTPYTSCAIISPKSQALALQFLIIVLMPTKFTAGITLKTLNWKDDGSLLEDKYLLAEACIQPNTAALFINQSI